MILADTGPLVALIHADDGNHERCVATLRTLHEPLGTVWPVVTEAMHLLGFSSDAQDRLWSMLRTPSLELLPLDETDMPRMRDLMRKYADLPMDLADAALVRVGERERIRRVFTLDQRDFRTYRPVGSKGFTLVP